MVNNKLDAGSLGQSEPPFETKELRAALKRLFDTPFTDPATGHASRVGSFRWGVYAFFDYDGEPIYVGQTYERLSGRVSRHLTNQRTDAVAMSVLDPFEVAEISFYPLPQFQAVNQKHPDFQDAKAHLNALEYLATEEAVKQSRFQAILNEKDAPKPTVTVKLPDPIRGRVVPDDVFQLRAHPDVRIARRAQIIARLAQTISERQVEGGLRRVLVTQAKRLQWLSEQRYQALGGGAIVETETNGDAEE